MKRKDFRLDYTVSLSFRITQNKTDSQLLFNITNYFKTGAVYESHGIKSCVYVVSDLKSIKNNIIPHFDKYPLQGKKLKDYNDWKIIFNMIINKEHLIKEGLNKIIEIKANMNSKRA